MLSRSALFTLSPHVASVRGAAPVAEVQVPYPHRPMQESKLCHANTKMNTVRYSEKGEKECKPKKVKRSTQAPEGEKARNLEG